MTSELWFYHLERQSVEAVLPPLLEKCLARGWRAIVRSPSAARLKALDAALWTQRDESFLPHGLDGPQAARQPILLCGLPSGGAAANGAKAAFLLDGAPLQDFEGFERVCVIFDGRDEAALAHARLQWKEATAGGMGVAYWKQSAEGSWVRQGNS